MKHLIIFNNAAGEGKAKEYLPNVEYSFEGLDYEIHLTQRPGEATTFLKHYLSTHKDPVRVYACGGDGTIYECVNGVYGYPNVELAVYAIGTGNDFVKVYGGREKFIDLVKIIKGTATEVDVTQIKSDVSTSPYYSINVINFGFDAIVGAVGNKYKLQGKKDPYSKALLPMLLFPV
jgi:diacylglycerol kinase family enzyme